MSYSNLNDAFNINSSFEKNIRGLNSLNHINTISDNTKIDSETNLRDTIPRFESNYFGFTNENTNGKNNSPNYQNNFYNPNDPLPIIDGMYSGDDNLSWESLNGTDLYSRGDNISASNKLTHRECIKIYNNPFNYNDGVLSQALKHVSKCKTCKNEIKNIIMANDTIKKKSNSDSNSNSKFNSKSVLKSEIQGAKRNVISENDNLSSTSYQNFHNPLNSGSSNLSSQSVSNSKIESELKLLSDKINGESNLKYQNALIHNNISKYLEDLEEKKKINQKLDNIIEILKSESVIKQDNTRDVKLNNGLESKDNNLMNILTSPQFLLNLSKLNEQNLISSNNMNNNQSTSVSTSYETYLLYISIFIIIILLIIDIVLRLSYKSD